MIARLLEGVPATETTKAAAGDPVRAAVMGGMDRSRRMSPRSHKVDRRPARLYSTTDDPGVTSMRRRIASRTTARSSKGWVRSPATRVGE